MNNLIMSGKQSAASVFDGALVFQTLSSSKETIKNDKTPAFTDALNQEYSKSSPESKYWSETNYSSTQTEAATDYESPGPISLIKPEQYTTSAPPAETRSEFQSAQTVKAQQPKTSNSDPEKNSAPKSVSSEENALKAEPEKVEESEPAPKKAQTESPAAQKTQTESAVPATASKHESVIQNEAAAANAIGVDRKQSANTKSIIAASSANPNALTAKTLDKISHGANSEIAAASAKTSASANTSAGARTSADANAKDTLKRKNALVENAAERNAAAAQTTSAKTDADKSAQTAQSQTAKNAANNKAAITPQDMPHKTVKSPDTAAAQDADAISGDEARAQTVRQKMMTAGMAAQKTQSSASDKSAVSEDMKAAKANASAQTAAALPKGAAAETAQTAAKAAEAAIKKTQSEGGKQIAESDAATMIASAKEGRKESAGSIAKEVAAAKQAPKPDPIKDSKNSAQPDDDKNSHSNFAKTEDKTAAVLNGALSASAKIKKSSDLSSSADKTIESAISGAALANKAAEQSSSAQTNKQTAAAAKNTTANKTNSERLSDTLEDNSIKVKSMTFETVKAEQPKSEQSGKEGQEVLKSLIKDNNLSYRLAQTNDKNTAVSIQADIPADLSALKSELAEKTLSHIKISAENQAKGDGALNSLSGKKSAAHENAGPQSAQDAGAAKTSKMTSSEAGQAANQSNPASNINAVQEVISKIQNTLRSEQGVENSSKISIEFESASLGQARMSVQKSGDSLSVSIQVSSESSKENLMRQRDDMSSQLMKMGYKEVNLSFSSGNGQEKGSFGRQDTSQGNQNAENVKLSGKDEKLDLSELLGNIA